MSDTNSISESELLLLSALAEMSIPLDCMFFKKSTFEREFREKWHGLTLDGVLVAISNLVASELVYLTKKENTNKHLLETWNIIVNLTAKGGALWEERRRVRWEEYIGDGDDVDEPSDSGQRIVFRSVVAAPLKQLAQMLEPHSSAFEVAPPGIASAGEWQWSRWKRFDRSYAMTVRIRAGAETPHFSAMATLFEIRDTVTQGFIDG